MKAISIRPEWAMPIWTWQKQVECRTWSTDYRGPLLICSSSRKTARCIAGHALCVVELLDVVPFAEEHLELSLMDSVPADSYAWILGGDPEKTGWVEPFPVKGKLKLYDVDDELIRIIPDDIGTVEAIERYYEPLVHLPREADRSFWDDMKANW